MTAVLHWAHSVVTKLEPVDGHSIVFEFQYPDGPFYNTFTWDAKAKGWTFRMESQSKEGKRVLFVEDTLRRP